VAEVLESSLPEGKLLKEEAELLLAGIMLDTDQFIRNTSERTFAAAFYLRGEGANPNESKALFKTSPELFVKQSEFASNTAVYRGVFAISATGGASSPSDRTAGAIAADRMLGIDGISASFVLSQFNGGVNISGRSNGKVNVQLILESFGGGGHYDVAGAQLMGVSLDEAVAMLKKRLDEYLSK